jgi:hypothetical protein
MEAERGDIIGFLIKITGIGWIGGDVVAMRVWSRAA